MGIYLPSPPQLSSQQGYLWCSHTDEETGHGGERGEFYAQGYLGSKWFTIQRFVARQFCGIISYLPPMGRFIRYHRLDTEEHLSDWREHHSGQLFELKWMGRAEGRQVRKNGVIWIGPSQICRGVWILYYRK